MLKKHLVFLSFLFGFIVSANASKISDVGAIRWGAEWESTTIYPWQGYTVPQTFEVTYDNHVYVNTAPATTGLPPDKDLAAWTPAGVISIPDSFTLTQSITNSTTQAPSSNAVKLALANIQPTVLPIIQTVNTSTTDVPSANAVKTAIAAIPAYTLPITQSLSTSTTDVPSANAVRAAIAAIPSGSTTATGIASASINTLHYQTIYPYKSGAAYPAASLFYTSFTDDSKTSKYISKAGNTYFAWDSSKPACVNVLSGGVARINAQANLVGGANGASNVNIFAFASSIMINGTSMLDSRMYNAVGFAPSSYNFSSDTGSGNPAFIVATLKKSDQICAGYGMVVTSAFVNGLYADYAMNIDMIDGE